MRSQPCRFSRHGKQYAASIPSTPATISQLIVNNDMKFIRLISNAFINTMGITQPSPQAANRASWFIFIMLCAVIAVVAAIAVVAIHLASHH
jgi:hypothetical protein